MLKLIAVLLVAFTLSACRPEVSSLELPVDVVGETVRVQSDGDFVVLWETVTLSGARTVIENGSACQVLADPFALEGARDETIVWRLDCGGDEGYVDGVFVTR